MPAQKGKQLAPADKNGKRLFGEGTVVANPKWEEYRVSATGMIMATHLPDEEILMSSFAREEPTAVEQVRRRNEQ